jgi:hypothetical protein
MQSNENTELSREQRHSRKQTLQNLNNENTAVGGTWIDEVFYHE